MAAQVLGPFHFLLADHGAFYGPVSGWVGDLAMLSIPVTLWRRHICHTPWCWRLGKHPDGLYMRCPKHHDQIPT